MRALAQLPSTAQQLVKRSAAPDRGFLRKAEVPALNGAVHHFGQISIVPKPSAGVQTKLTVSTPGDRFEQEADRVAERVMRMPDPSVPPCACGSAEEDSKDLLQAKGEPGGAATGRAPQAVHDALGSTGQPLDTGARSFFEPRFASGFGHVRVHTGPDAARAARSVNALAFTVGRDIVFGAGRYQPRTDAGKSLLAHELTHVLQQGGSQQTLMRVCDCAKIGGRQPDPTDPLEAGVASAFPGLVPGDWCVLAAPTPRYNCYAWTISDTTQWIGDAQVDAYGDGDGMASIADFDAFYSATQNLTPQSSPDSNTLVALFAKNGHPTHGALTATDAESCGTVPFTSKLGRGPLIAHDLYQLQGTTYGQVVRYYE